MLLYFKIIALKADTIFSSGIVFILVINEEAMRFHVLLCVCVCVHLPAALFSHCLSFKLNLKSVLPISSKRVLEVTELNTKLP